MTRTWITLALCCAAGQLSAQFTTTFQGIERDGDKDVPASATFSVENGRVAMLMKGAHSSRMLFDQTAQVLRVVNDEDKTYFDIDKHAGSGVDAMMASMKKQLDAMPAAQRAMAEQMMQGAMGSMSQPTPLEYVRTREKLTVAGYECTRVEGMRGQTKTTEYCGTTSDDFKISDAERQTILEMQGYLRNFTIMVKSADDVTRAFQWDLNADGYPIITRCFKNGKLSLDLTFHSLSRTPIPDAIFAVPTDFKKVDMNAMMRPGR